MKALVLAAGRGERLKPLTDQRPKAMFPVVGKPILNYVIEDCKLAGVTEVVAVVGFGKEMIRGHFGDGEGFGVKITYIEQNSPLGEADAILRAEESLSSEDYFIMAHGDYVSERGLVSRVVESYRRSESDIAVALTRVENPSEYGIAEINKGGCVARIVEKPRDWRRLGNLAVSSVYVFKPTIFDTLKKVRQLEKGISRMISKGSKAVGVIWEKGWVDVGRPWDVLAANRLILSRIFSRNPRYISPTASYRSKDQLEEPYHVSDNVEIDRGAFVRRGCFLDKGSRIGTNALIRDYSYIGENTIAGYSTEVKNSVILSNSSLGHIAFVGDSVIGSSCEIGAGVITSNVRFDGAPIQVKVQNRRRNSGLSKLGAIIGDGVKIGVNASICPGCKIGSNTWIGPGVMVSSDIPEDSFVSADRRVKIRKRRVTPVRG